MSMRISVAQGDGFKCLFCPVYISNPKDYQYDYQTENWSI